MVFFPYNGSVLGRDLIVEGDQVAQKTGIHPNSYLTRFEVLGGAGPETEETGLNGSHVKFLL